MRQKNYSVGINSSKMNQTPNAVNNHFTAVKSQLCVTEIGYNAHNWKI